MLRVRGIERVRLHADLTILGRLALELAKARQFQSQRKRLVTSAGQSLAALGRADRPIPTKTAANTKKTTPMPEESRVKSTIAIMKNKTPARTLASACLDMVQAYPDAAV
jgi:hypothetical protein